ncbi:MAG: PTS sugar transporter subunit IIC [Streptococcaceae bacterium]|jgi:PTS system cellobiose-specific IIC component|nr:PTS sugar transporter subunit IIC [Streptococcaceae bacterium]
MNKFINETLLPPVMRFVNTKAVTAIRNGMMYPLPFIIIGSFFLILGQLPYQPLQDYLFKIGLAPIFLQANTAAFGIMAVWAAFGIAYAWVKEEGYEGAPAGITSIIVLVLLQPNFKAVVDAASKAVMDPTTKTPLQTTGILDTAWLGGKGMIMAMVGGLLVGWIYSWFMKKKIIIRLPEQVPENVSNSFAALIPSAVIISGATLIYGLFHYIANQTPIEWVYAVIQRPLQGVTDGPVGVFVLAFLPVFLWFFGVHGAAVVSGVMSALLLANTQDNAALYKAHELTLSHGAHIVTQAFMDQFLTVTGSGLTMGLAIFLLFFAKSEQLKAIGKVEIGPAIFNINEPILFGMPIVLNPFMGVPFMLAPLASGILTYLAIYTQIIPPFTGILVPWTTPAILSGLLAGGWQAMLWQILMLVLAGAIYWPFARKYDRQLYAQEQEMLKEEHAGIEAA